MQWRFSGRHEVVDRRAMRNTASLSSVSIRSSLVLLRYFGGRQANREVASHPLQRKRARSRGRNQFNRCLCLDLLVLIVSSRGAFPETVNGFVTRVESTKVFDVGTVKVALSDTTKCSSETVYGIRVESGVTADIPSAVYMLRPKAFFRLDKMIERPISCKTARITVGLRVHAQGAYTSNGQYAATKLIIYEIRRPTSYSGSTILEEANSLQPGMEEASVWIDGYRMLVTGKAFPKANRDVGQWRAKLRAGDSIIYQATVGQDETLIADSIETKTRQEIADSGFLKFFSAKNEPNDCGQAAGGSDHIEMRDGLSIEVVPNQQLQEFVSRIGLKLVPRYQSDLSLGNVSRAHFRFCVVRAFSHFKEGDLITINGTLPHDDPEWGYDFTHPSDSRRQRSILALPTGMILIPDKALANIKNEAQLAALLSYAITSVLQEDGYEQWSLAKSKNMHDKKNLFTACLELNEQVIRIGIRQMYLAGYDIREAPLAWDAAQGIAVEGAKVDESQTNVKPWYAAYAYEYISSFYADAEFARMKRGETEYAQFVKALRAADPQAFEKRK